MMQGTDVEQRMQEKLDLVYEFIKRYLITNNYPPTIRDIRDGCRISSTSVVSYYLDKLADKKMIQRDENRARSIVVLGNPQMPDPELTTYLKGPRWRNLKGRVKSAAVLSGCEVVWMDEEKELLSKTLLFTVRGKMAMLNLFQENLGIHIGKFDDNWNSIRG